MQCGSADTASFGGGLTSGLGEVRQRGVSAAVEQGYYRLIFFWAFFGSLVTSLTANLCSSTYMNLPCSPISGALAAQRWLGLSQAALMLRGISVAFVWARLGQEPRRNRSYFT